MIQQPVLILPLRLNHKGPPSGLYLPLLLARTASLTTGRFIVTHYD